MPKSADFFPEKTSSRPMVYAYRDTNPNHLEFLKVGYTTIGVEERVRQQFPVIQPEEHPYAIVFAEPAMRDDGTSFTDHDLHRWLDAHGFENVGGEWYHCEPTDVRAAWIAVRDRTENDEVRDWDFPMRPEQAEAVSRTRAYFESVNAEGSQRTPKFLWNAKMRFGKTFATYELAKSMGMRRVLVLTFKPAVQSAWEEDLSRHVDFEGWQFVSRTGRQYRDCDARRPIVCFGSFQDYLGLDANGNIKARHEWVRATDWDLVVFDEYHFGCWRDTAKKLFDSFKEDEEAAARRDVSVTGNEQDETWLPIVTRYFLFLSGTPFRALNSGEFIEEQIFNWTYSDEQAAKEGWDDSRSPNPYASLPRIVMMAYQMPDDIKRIALNTDTNEFDLNTFFSAEGTGSDAQFKFKEYVQKWLDLIRGAHLPTTVDELKTGERPALPFSDVRLLGALNHTLWYLPSVASCYSMANLLGERQNTFYHDYTVNVCAGAQAGIGLAALEPVERSMRDPLESKTITLSCGKLTTGVTVKPWTGVFMLSNVKSPESYFQTAFRVQSPWTIRREDGSTEIVKKECYVFDFALNRALSMVSDYSTQLASDPKQGPEQKVGEFIRFLPVLAYDGSRMTQVDAAAILDMAMAGTSATLLAKRWESAMLVNVDNDTLRRLLANPDAIAAIEKIEGFRNLNVQGDIETIINKSEAVKKAKKERGEELTPKEKKELSAEEKEFKSKRREIQEKLIKFATRIPIFMYLTDYREETLYDVITQLEPGLFKKVTGLEVDDFNLLVSLGVFNSGVMNDAVYKFRRYEDASLTYMHVNKHEGERVGLFDTTLSEFEYLEAARRESMVLPNGRSNPDRGSAGARADRRPKPQASRRPVAPAGASARSNNRDGGVTREPGSTPEPRRDWIMDALDDDGLRYVDQRSAGECLWVIGGGEIEAAIAAINAQGASFEFNMRGSRATRGASGWYMRGYPEHVDERISESNPPVTEGELRQLEVGDTVFHKAFGYGEVTGIDWEKGSISVKLGKKSRAFMFPSSFYQGLLTML